MKENHPCVIISNHQDNLDIFAGALALPDRTVSIGKRSIIWIPFFGLYYWLSGNILIDRKNKRSAFETMDVAVPKLLEKIISLCGLCLKEHVLVDADFFLFKKGPFITRH